MAGDRTESPLEKDPSRGAEPTTNAATTTRPASSIKPERCKEILARRRLATQFCSENSFNASSPQNRNQLRTQFNRRSLRTGIAFSGGGIRSATISLGLTEALAARGRFYAFDMMSTVSGGGYFGTFLRSLFVDREADNGGAENTAIVENRLAFADAVITSLPDQQYFRSNGNSSYFVKPKFDPDKGKREKQAIKNPLWWLRENGRYLAPNGTTDYVFALAFFVRNWITMMIIILAAMLLAFAVLHMIMIGGNALFPSFATFADAVSAANAVRDGTSLIPWSPLLALFVPGLLIVGGIGLGYWFSLGLTYSPSSPDRSKDVWRLGFWWASCGLIIAGLLLFDPPGGNLVQMLKRGAMIVLLGALMSSVINALRRDASPVEKKTNFVKLLRGIRIDVQFTLIWLLGTLIAGLIIAEMAGCLPTSPPWRVAIIAVIATSITCMIIAFGEASTDPVSISGYYRRLQTRTLSQAAQIVAIIVFIGLIDTLGLFIRALSNAPDQASFAKAALTSSALLSLIAALIAKLPDWLGGSKLSIVRILKTNANTAAFIAALVMLTALAVLADLLVLKTLWEGTAWATNATFDFAAFAMTSGSAFFIVLFIGRSTTFLNQSALAPIYASRLGRAYLGGSNCYRLTTHTASDITRGMIGDDMAVDFYMQQECAAPLHFINVTRNRTTGTANNGATDVNKRIHDDPFVLYQRTHLRRRLEGYDSHLTLRDRKGDRMVIGPSGIRAGADFFRWEDMTATHTDEKLPPDEREKRRSDESEKLRLSQLCAISGAAVSSGMGRNTSLGTAMALTLANVRLGHWWRAPAKNAAGKVPTRGEPTGLGKWLHSYSYLLDELLARYDRDKPYWYLSDGGHSENSGALTLLERNCRFILVADNGQDPDSHFADLETFVRTARTDIGMEVDTPTGEEFAEIINREARSCFLNNKSESWAEQLASPDNEAFALLLKAVDMRMLENGKLRPPATEPSWIVWLKPTLFKGLPVDITTYGRLNPDFPQQSTTNQFFDEAQWESYRRLGFAMGYRLFADRTTLADTLPPIFQALAPVKAGKNQ